METRPIAFDCIQDRIHLFICSLHSWQDVLFDHARFGVVRKERSTRDLRQPSTGMKLLESMCFKRQRSVCIIQMRFVFENPAESAPHGSRGR